MAKQFVEKQDFYQQIVAMMEEARYSIRFYTISCCFGFYSHGLSNFEVVMLSLRDGLRRIVNSQYLDVRALIKVDHENPIDVYAAERLAQLESRYLATGDSDTDRNVFRELRSDYKDVVAVQFMIIDDREILVSAIQEELYNEDLDLVLNKSQRGTRFERDDDTVEFQKYAQMFEDSWNASTALDVKIRHVSRRKLRYFLERYKGAHRASNERELHLLLTGYLQGLFDPSVVDLETTVGGTRIDLLVGKRPHHARNGIEVKFRPDNKAVHEIVGQVRNYRKEFEDVVLIVSQPKYSPQRRDDLVSELEDINVGLIELD